MKKLTPISLLLFFSFLHITTAQELEKSWMLGPFYRPTNAAPIITKDASSTFEDPITKKMSHWESMATFNPAAVVKNDTIFVLYRAEEKLGEKEIGGHRSRIGMAFSTDAKNYQRLPHPIFYPKTDNQKQYEWPGGVEDPRIVKTEDGTYVMTYTQWNREVPRLAIATSNDLMHWKKHGPIFREYQQGKYHDRETKSGAIVTQLKNGELVAAKIDDSYWMYYGVPHVWLAHSKDLINWTPLETHEGKLAPVLSPRPGYFDSWLVEAGPPPLLTDDGIVVIYNAGNSQTIGVSELGNRIYTGGQALFDAEQPWKILDRTTKPFIKPELPFEKSGQYKDGTTFLEGMVLFNGQWHLYYGTADSMVGVVSTKKP